MAMVEVREAPLWKKLAGYVGPGFLVSVAYLDPGNLQTDLHAGAYHEFELLWIVLVGLIFALIIQSRSSNLGVATGKHLAEHCRAEYPKILNYGLWAMAEVAVIAADIPEVIGTAFALNLLFKVPIWCGVLLAGLSTLLLLGVQKYGMRKLEVVIVSLVLVMGGCFFAEMAMAKPDVVEVMKGMFVPRLKGKGAADDAVALLGALVMPHNLFLHSALVISRKIPQTSRGIERACRSFLVESGAALLVAFLINVAVVSVSGVVCGGGGGASYSVGKDGCGDISLSSASALLKNTLGKWSSKLYAVSLLASGLSSTITGTYAGQYIMQGFLDLKMKTWLRNLTTRCVAIVPSLIVAVIGGSSGAGRLIIIASMILSFELPFTLIPLLKFTASEAKMGDHRNYPFVTAVSWLLGCCLTGINTYVLSTTLVGWCLRLPKAAAVLATVAVFSLMMAYLGGLAFLTFRNGPVCGGGGLPLIAMSTIGEPKQNGGAAETEGVATVVSTDEDNIAPPAA